MKRFRSVKVLAEYSKWVPIEGASVENPCPNGCAFCKKLEYERTHKEIKEYQYFTIGACAVNLQTKEVFYAEEKDSMTYKYTPALPKGWKVVDIVEYTR